MYFFDAKNIDQYSYLALQAGKVLLTFGLAFLIIRILRISLKRQAKKGAIDEGHFFAIVQISRYVLIVIAVVISLDTFGININVLLAGSAALLVGLGLGIQQIFNDVVSGIILLVEGSVKVGDIIESEKIVGEVRKIGLRTSEVLTRDDVVMIVPNSKFVSEKVVNWTHNNLPTRFKIQVGVAYGSDVELVMSILSKCADLHEDVESDETRKPFARFVDFGDSSLDFELYFYSLNMFRIENVKSDIRSRIYKELERHNIIIPFPQRDIHLIPGNSQ